MDFGASDINAIATGDTRLGRLIAAQKYDEYKERLEKIKNQRTINKEEETLPDVGKLKEEVNNDRPGLGNPQDIAAQYNMYGQISRTDLGSTNQRNDEELEQ